MWQGCIPALHGVWVPSKVWVISYKMLIYTLSPTRRLLSKPASICPQEAGLVVSHNYLRQCDLEWVRKPQPDCLTVPICLAGVRLLKLSHLLCFEPSQLPPCHISSPVTPREQDWHKGTEVTTGGCLWPLVYPLQANNLQKSSPCLLFFEMQLWSKLLPPSLLIFRHWCLDI